MSAGPEVVVLYVTAPDGATAEVLARELVDARLAACVNVVPGIRSHYRWKGQVCVDEEVLLLCKTRRELVEAATARVLALHSYELPCVTAVPVVGGSPAFLSWVDAQTRPDPA